MSKFNELINHGLFRLTRAKIFVIFITILILSFVPMYLMRLLKNDSKIVTVESKLNADSQPSHTNDSIAQSYVKLFGQSPPLGFEKWVEFAKEKKCELDPSYYKQIYTDLDPWMHGRSISNMSEYISKYPRISDLGIKTANFRVKTQSFSQDNKLLKSIAHLLKYDFEYLKNGYDEPLSIPADDDDGNYESVVDIVYRNSCVRNISSSILNSHGFFQGPDSFVSINGLFPVLSQAKHYCYKDILMPMDYHTGFSEDSFTDNISWHEKKNILFWRGSTTGGSNREGKPWQKYHRIRLVDWEKKWAKNRTQFVLDTGKMSDNLEELNQTKFNDSSKYFVDIGFSGYCQIDYATTKIFEVKYPLKASVSFEKTMKFKYLLVIDGNTWPSRIQKYFQTNSVILYNGIFTDFYLGMLKPWVHYVPIRSDLADLEEKMDWLIANDDKAHTIAMNAKALMHKLGRSEHLQCYTGLLFQEYGRIFGNLRE